VLKHKSTKHSSDYYADQVMLSFLVASSDLWDPGLGSRFTESVDGHAPVLLQT